MTSGSVINQQLPLCGGALFLLWVVTTSTVFPSFASPSIGVDAFVARIQPAFRSGSGFSMGNDAREELALWQTSSSNTDDEPILSSASTNASMSQTSRISHAMVKVPSVDDAVAFWKSKGGKVVISRSNGKTNGEEELLSAWISLGYVGSGSDKDDDVDDNKNSDDNDGPKSFALEIVKGSVANAGEDKSGDHQQLGLSYLGLSMLLKLQDKNTLLELMKGNEETKQKESNDNNSDASESEFFPIKYVASAPGDGFAQLALRSNGKLMETFDFYTTVLGMDQKAQDSNLLCLRYDQEKTNDDNKSSSGVATALVFENCPAVGKIDNDDDFFDHLAIKTTSSIGGLHLDILENNESKEKVPVDVYMKPANMFGSHILGLIDPNGYKVVVYGDTE